MSRLDFILLCVIDFFILFLLVCPLINIESRLETLETYCNINYCSECGQILHK